MSRSTTLLRRTSGPTRRSSKGGWTEEEDNMLANAVKKFNGKNWKKIAEHFPDRTDVQCLHRWQKVLNPELVKGPWTKEEDESIAELVQKHGCRKWSSIAKSLPRRNGKQCRERWHNHLDPAIKKEAWTEEEETLISHYHKIYGNKWAKIAIFLPGRTDNAIKNHWNCSLKKRLDLEAFQASVPSIDQTSESNVNLPTVKAEEFFHPDNWLDSDSGSETCYTELALGNTPQTTPKTIPKTETTFSIKEQDGILGSSELYMNRLSTMLFDQRNASLEGLDISLNMSTQTNHEDSTPTPTTPCKRIRNHDLTFDMGFSNLDKSFLSLSTPGLTEDTSSLGQKKDPYYGQLWYKPPEFITSSAQLEAGIGYVENNRAQLSPLCFSTPISCGKSAPTSPETILRNSAMSFKTPSIIRKRNSRESINSDAKLKIREVAHKPVERCLEPSFDMEANLGDVKKRPSIASSNHTLGLMSLS